MKDEIVDNVTASLPVLIIPVERKIRNVLRAMSFILIITLLVAVITSATIAFFQGAITESAAPASESEMGGWASIINLIYVLSLVILATFFIIFIIKKGKITLFRAIMTVLMVYLIFIFTQFMVIIYGAYIYFFLYSSFHIPINDLAIYALEGASYIIAILFSVLYIISVAKLKFLNIRNAILILVGVWTATWLSWNLGILTPIAFMIGFAVYDLYSVFKGPLKELSQVMTEELGDAREREFGVILGLGDVFFYSFAVGYSFAVLSLFEVFVVVFCIFVGALITVYLLLKYHVEALPALPIPLLLAICLILLFMYLV